MEVFRNTVCPGCGRDLRVCRNCVFYSPGSHWDCRETIREAVRDKERANFCDYFRYSDRTPDRPNASNENARDAFDRLFGVDER